MVGQSDDAQTQSVAERVDAAVRPLLDSEGYDLVLVEYVGASQILRLYIDKEAGVGIDDCTRVSRWVSDLLDAEAAQAGFQGRC